MLFKVVALTILLHARSSDGSGSLLFTAVADLVRCLRCPIQLTALTCWNESEKLNLWRKIDAIRAPKVAIRMAGETPTDLPWNDRNQHQSLLLVDTSCPGSKQLLRQSGQMLYYRAKWIVVNRKELDCRQFLAFFMDLKVLISNEVYYLCKSPESDGFVIKQVYRFSMGTELVDETFGHWNRGMVVISMPTAIAAVRRQNLNHFKLRSSVVIRYNDTMKHLTDYREKHVDTITKMNYFLTKYVVESLNATVQFSYVDSWGYRNPDTGRFSGMIGELQGDQADLGGTALFLTADRIKEIDYLSMTTPTRAKFIFRSPKLSVTDNVFLLPFSGTVWLCIVSFILLSGILLLVIMVVEFHYTNIRYGSGNLPKLLDPIMNMFGTSCQQGSYIEPKSLPARCLILLSLIILMFLYASYSANIVALIQSPSHKIRTLEDLLNSRMETGAEDTVYNKYYFMHETEPVRKMIFERKMKSRNGSLTSFIPLEQGVQKIRQGLYAFHVELGVCYKVISETYQEDEKCDLQEIEYLNVIDPYYAVQKNSSFREIIRLSLFRLREFGIQGREHSIFYTKKPSCAGGSSSFSPVSIVDVWPALILLGWGFGISSGLLIGESMWNKAGGRNRIGDVNTTFLKQADIKK